MRKILVFSSLLVLAAGAYAAEHDQAAASSGQQTATTPQSSTQGQSAASGDGQSAIGGGQAGGQGGAQAGGQQPANYEFAASKLMGKPVVNGQGENVGSVKDVIVGQNGEVSHAIISVGGFLGIGERLVSVPFEELQTQDDKIIYGSASKEQLAQMPEFQYKEDQQQRAQQEQRRQQAQSGRDQQLGGAGQEQQQAQAEQGGGR
jgi:sporulation protein YlmC with PRC-barrel domain